MQVGVYDHVPGDGREFVVTEEATVKVSAALQLSSSSDLCRFGRRTADP